MRRLFCFTARWAEIFPYIVTNRVELCAESYDVKCIMNEKYFGPSGRLKQTNASSAPACVKYGLFPHNLRYQ